LIAGKLTWINSRTGQETGSIGYEANLRDHEAPWIRLSYTVAGNVQDYRVTLESTPCRFGGLRWWWLCPRTSHRSAKLFLPPGCTMFLSRRAYRMSYGSERGGPVDRSHARQARLRAKLGADYRVFMEFAPPRPKGMHHRTYERICDDLDAAILRHEAIFALGAARIAARLETVNARQRG
jgi:hypothetical protein